VRVDAERDRRIGVAELARDEDHVQPLGDQQRGEAVPERVQRQPPRRLQAGPPDRAAEGATDAPVVEALPARGREDEVVRRLVQRRQATLAQLLRQREHDLPLARLGLQRRVAAVAPELAVDPNQTGLVVDVGPG